MIDNIFYFVLNMSITAGLIVIILLIIRGCFSRWIPKAAIYFLWGIVLFRLLVPISIPSEFSLLNLLSGYLTKTVAVSKGSEIIPNISTLNSIQAANSYFPLEYKSETLKTIFTVLGSVWICGASIFVIALIVMYNLTAAQLKKAILIRDSSVLGRCSDRLSINSKVRLFESGFVVSPIVFGILYPRIIIPKDVDKQSLEYVLLHELTHVERRDNLWKMISMFAVCIHWFNPLAWLFLYIADQDMELACDAKVLKGMADEDRRYYAEALVSLASRQRASLTAFGGTAVKQRVMNIVSYKRVSLIMAVITAMVYLTLALLLLTNPGL
ncbi:M56 family metallopeptidase [Desulfosporosinus nitroreducens]|uniref:M56 family metallopeptidase n=1 Tax=Desulfosporosinus nitroreducens TaxID=2018668 RepID=UPI00207CD392|nr:M56 family metallopeptidase [Desulfosporosinus nitroreducens]MCO1603885.1 M56 family metallopeptidase [Desulfosporosinus nitroreducens]